MSENFTSPEAAAMYVTAYDDDARYFSRRSLAALAVDEKRMLGESGGQRIAGGPVGRDELVASILELRYPRIAEARAMLATPEPGSETVPPMSDEAMLRLVEDGSNDYVEGIGERGGYVSYSVEGDMLTVKVQVFAGAGADDLDELVTTERKWKLTRVEAGA